MLEPLISVLIPVYNAEKYLAACIDSILNQTYRNLEIILIDDGSTDLSGEICDQYAARDGRIRVHHKANCGVSAARNDALARAHGDYICFVDSDDYVELNMCARIVEAFEAQRADIVIFGCIQVHDSGKTKKEKYKGNVLLSSEEALLELMNSNMQSYFCNKAFKRKGLDNVVCLPGRVWEDLGTVYKAFLNVDQIYCMEDYLYYYRQHENSIVHTINEKALCDIFFQRRERYEMLLKDYPHIAQAGFAELALSAIRLYDRSLWKNIDNDDLKNAKQFLENNKKKLLHSKDCIRYILYFCCKDFYDICRRAYHGMGNVFRNLHGIMNRIKGFDR